MLKPPHLTGTPAYSNRFGLTKLMEEAILKRESGNVEWETDVATIALPPIT